MKKILVTGCNGQLGRAIRKEYAGSDVEFVNTDVTEGEGVKALDITDVDAVLKMVEETKPEVIINCAAHTNVDYDMIQKNAKAIFDTKNVMKNIENRENIEVL